MHANRRMGRCTRSIASLAGPALWLAASACYGELTPIDTAAIAGADAGPAQAFAYRPDLQSELEGLGCTAVADCHGTDGVPMVVHAGPADDAAWQANYDEVLTRSRNGSSSMLLMKPTGLGGHPVLFDTGAPVVARWQTWIDDGAQYQ